MLRAFQILKQATNLQNILNWLLKLFLKTIFENISQTKHNFFEFNLP